jgi:hypothetical protein
LQGFFWLFFKFSSDIIGIQKKGQVLARNKNERAF